MIKELICISCPVGCRLKVDITDPKNITVAGNACNRGITYGIDEVTNPKRIVTTTVCVLGGTNPVVSVKTKSPVPKTKVQNVLNALKGFKASAPVRLGQVLLSNVCDTGVDIISTREVGLR